LVGHDREAKRLRLTLQGAIQGVGFRPFVWRLADALGLKGFVSNSPSGVLIEVEGPARRLEEFLLRIGAEGPPHAFIQSLESAFLDPKGYSAFEIKSSRSSGKKTAIIAPDIATCPECLEEIFDPFDRRYLYPFTNCTQCGPRFSILEALPYDRRNTSMKKFAMCPACLKEYRDPRSRRYHAQPNACPVCGPSVQWRDANGRVLAKGETALEKTVHAIRQGKIVALKGLGGFQLLTDAMCDVAVRRLRARKRREEKPFALMMPSLEMAQRFCRISKMEARLLKSPEAPIVLLEKKAGAAGRSLRVAAAVAPGNPTLGVMLPYTPLHHILLSALKIPVVATSGNLAEEPIVTDEKVAIEKLRGIADFYLEHNRPIVRPMDDSIARVIAGRPMILRRARGYAPLPFYLKKNGPPALAVGAHLKNTVAVSAGPAVYVSQHIGDLETAETFKVFQKSLADLAGLYGKKPVRVVCDLHPGYLSTKYAERLKLPVTHVQHHAAHIFSCLAENEITGPALGVAWDGTGWGEDQTVWGG
jgi:hydrogenase maturation protein HypF